MMTKQSVYRAGVLETAEVSAMAEPRQTVPTRGLHESRLQPHPLLTLWVFAYQLPLAFDPPEESIKAQ
jgi:hypothetical protein